MAYIDYINPEAEGEKRTIGIDWKKINRAEDLVVAQFNGGEADIVLSPSLIAKGFEILPEFNDAELLKRIETSRSLAKIAFMEWWTDKGEAEANQRDLRTRFTDTPAEYMSDPKLQVPLRLTFMHNELFTMIETGRWESDGTIAELHEASRKDFMSSNGALEEQYHI